MSIVANSVHISDSESLRSIEQDDGTSVRTDIFIREHKPSLWRLQISVVIVLCVVAAVVGACSFHFARAIEKGSFRRFFKEDSNIVLMYSVQNLLATCLHTYAFSLELSVVSSKGSMFWPNVTLEEFETSSFIQLYPSIVRAAFLAPIVTQATRSSWEAYAASSDPEGEIKLTGNRSIGDGIYHLVDGLAQDEDRTTTNLTPFFPIWQVAPRSVDSRYIMFNQASDLIQQTALAEMLKSKSLVTSSMFYSKEGKPQFSTFAPIFDNQDTMNVVGSLSLQASTSSLFDVKLSRAFGAVDVVLDCVNGDQYTFNIVRKRSGSLAQEVSFIGEGDHHDSQFDTFEASFSMEDQVELWRELSAKTQLSNSSVTSPFIRNILENPPCNFHFRLYPTAHYQDVFLTKSPYLLAIGSSTAILLAGCMFLLYNCLSERRQVDALRKTKRRGEVTRALVKSFFPPVVRERVVLSTSLRQRTTALSRKSPHAFSAGRLQIIEPIAEQFPSATVIFADLAGFTAWSSQREPEAVFTLLENVFEKFDTLAVRFGVFKVETIGDCYMAVCGLPDPNEDHAIVASRFAHECVLEMEATAKELESKLGPGTCDLKVRVGLHSGSVIGGVLRGAKVRFQLFGDTVNTAARMETNGIPGRVQVSQATATLLRLGGKGHWLVERVDRVKAKGKGYMQTYFVKPRPRLRPLSLRSAVPSDEIRSNDCMDLKRSQKIYNEDRDRKHRLSQWNADLLLRCLVSSEHTRDHIGASSYGEMFGAYQSKIRSQLRLLIDQLIEAFPDKPFHNLEHTSICVQFADKLIKLAIEEMRQSEGRDPSRESLYCVLHFAVVFSVLIRDILHDEADDCQHLTSLILQKFNLPEYDALHDAICNPSMDKSIYFESIFWECIRSSTTTRINDKLLDEEEASVMLSDKTRHMVRLVSKCADVAHWMQHWETFALWQGRLFKEISENFADGMVPQDLAESWCEDQEVLFRNVVLPLVNELAAQNLGWGYANRAQENFQEWYSEWSSKDASRKTSLTSSDDTHL